VCRFLMVKSAGPFAPAAMLESFAEMAEKSRAPDGDRQADGWGIAWPDGDGGWIVRKSIRPVWEDAGAFAEIPASSAFVVHARSASFPDQKNVLDYNQPYASKKAAFVFNGLLRGVALPFPVEGRIGAQKIWSLLSSGNGGGPAARLQTAVEVLVSHAREVQALNLGLFEGGRMFAFCRDTGNGGYYRLHGHSSPGLAMVCSEPLRGFALTPLPTDSVLEF